MSGTIDKLGFKKAVSRILMQGFLLIFVVMLMIGAFVVPAQAQVQVTSVPINGEIQKLTLTNAGDIYSGGMMVVAGYTVILPRHLLIDLPANRLTLQQIFAQAPAGCPANESGLAKTDNCNPSGTGGFATITANRSALGDVIAGDVFIQKGTEVVSGTVTYINYTDGYFRMNGALNDATTGIMVRLNDPDSRHTIQQGAGCAGGPNCSPDPRFTLDPDNYVTTFSTGYPWCIPSTVPRLFTDVLDLNGNGNIAEQLTTQAGADGTGDLLCPLTNRTDVALETAVDSRRFAPLKVGDPVTAEGNFETINGVRFLSSHTTQIKKSMWTTNAPGQPDYLFLDEVFIGGPGFENQRALALFIGYTTMGPTAPAADRTDVDIWSIHRDPITNDMHEFPLASVRGCDASGGPGTCSSMGLLGAGANIFRIRYDVDFILAALGGGLITDAKLSPCPHLTARWPSLNLCAGGSTLATNFAVLSPVPHEIIARTGRKQNNPSLITLDINGEEVPNGEYLFPLGMNLGGIETAEFNEIDLNQMAKPVIFEGIPWNLDRRLGPSGCLNNAGDPVACPGGGPILLDPFPFSGLNPGLQADFTVNVGGVTILAGTPKGTLNPSFFTNSPLSNAHQRTQSFVTDVGGGVFNFDGNNTVLPFTLAVAPPDQGIISEPTPTFTLAISPVGFTGQVRAQNDSAVTRAGVPVSISVLSNDTALVGLINFASITIVSPAANGTAAANPNGTVTYTPGPGFSGGDTFTYTFSELTSGEVSNAATVSVVVNSLATGSFTPGAAVSLDDALKAIRIAVGLVKPTADDLLNGDVAPLGAPDGQINTADALLILKKAVGLVNF